MQYRINTASYQPVLDHLKKCCDSFIPNLSQKVNLVGYAKKIKDNAFTFEAWKEEELVGLVAAYFTDTINRSAFITNVSTIKQYEGTGIGSELLNNCIRYAVKHQFREIKLHVSIGNNIAIALYHKYGFIEKAIEAGELLMQKEILF